MAKKKVMRAGSKPQGSKKPPAKAPAKSPAKKAPAKKSSGMKASPKASAPAKGNSLAPRPVTTGKSPDVRAVGSTLVKMFNEGKHKEIEELYWSPQIESVEGYGVGLAWRGRDAVNAKNQQWSSENTILGASAEGPYLGSSGFAVKFRMEVRTNATGQTKNFEEIGVYTIQDGKIVREEFMYGG